MSNQPNQGKRTIKPIEICGLFIFFSAIVMLFVNPDAFGNAFDAMTNKVTGIVTTVYLAGKWDPAKAMFIPATLTSAVIVSVIAGRVLERLGMTDAMLRVFMPFAKLLGLNPTIVVPGVYNILGDINAAGRIAGPVLRRAGATKDEQKIAIATMIQAQQSFSVFMIGLLAMSLGGIKPALVIILGILAPMVLVPFILSRTIWRDIKPKTLDELPSFTPTTDALSTVFGAGREGAELIFLLIIPSAAVIFAMMGLLEFWGVWAYIEQGIKALLQVLAIEPTTGLLSVVASPTLAMNVLKEMAPTLADKRLIVGSFILAASGFPLQVIFAQIPAIWKANSDLNEKEAMGAAVIGAVIRLLTCGLMAYAVTPLVLK